MKKITYLMMLALGLTAVNGVNAEAELTMADRVQNTQNFVEDMGKVKMGKGRKFKVMAKHLGGALGRNKEIVDKAKQAITAAASAA